jgi:pyruvate formate lyase activating enzyme
MSVTGMVLDIDRFSTHDGPGIRTTVFLKGCPLRCKWCHSPESQLRENELFYKRMRCTGCHFCVVSCPQNAIRANGEIIEGVSGISIDRNKCVKCFICTDICNSRALHIGGKEYSSSDIIKSIKPDIDFFLNSGGGVTVTGGEPLMQAEFTWEILSECKKLGIHTMIETCGMGSGVELKKIANECLGIYYDIKLMDPVKHHEWTEMSNKIIIDNLYLLCISENMANKITVRIPCIPGINDDPENIRDTAEYVASLKIPVIQLMPYNSMASEKYRWIGKNYLLSNSETRNKGYYEELNRIIESVGIKAIRE